jgi:glutaredoxin
LALRLIEDAKREMPDLELKEVDITQHPAVAVRHGVMSTPAIVINGRLEFLGVPRGDALLDRLRAVRE